MYFEWVGATQLGTVQTFIESTSRRKPLFLLGSASAQAVLTGATLATSAAFVGAREVDGRVDDRDHVYERGL